MADLFGAEAMKSDGVILRHCATIARMSDVVTLDRRAEPMFAPSDKDKLVMVFGAGPGGRNLVGHLAEILAEDRARLSVRAETSVAYGSIAWGTDNAPELQLKSEPK